jgi:hypothetical protein
MSTDAQEVQRMSAVPFWASRMLGVALIADLWRSVKA